MTREQGKFRKQLADAFGGTAFAPLEEHVRRNMEQFQQTFSMFAPFVPPRADATKVETPALAAEDNTDELRWQMKKLQERLDRMSTETEKEVRSNAAVKDPADRE